MVYVLLALIGLMFGSFINAVVWRLRQQSKKTKDNKYSIMGGRSMCPHCKHTLSAKDLVPLLSWMWLRGRCRYCKKPISIQYPLVEIAMALVFIASYIWWPRDLAGSEWTLFVSWLASSVGLMALLVYDAKYMLLPNKIIYPTLAVAASGRLIYLLSSEPNKLRALGLWASSVAVASGVFAVLFYVSKGQWIGYGDVRLGLITGTLLANPAESFLMIFLASVLGILFIIPSLLTRTKNLASRLPFGPFLIAGTGVAILFGPQILDWYKRVFLP